MSTLLVTIKAGNSVSVREVVSNINKIRPQTSHILSSNLTTKSLFPTLEFFRDHVCENVSNPDNTRLKVGWFETEGGFCCVSGYGGEVGTGLWTFASPHPAPNIHGNSSF